MLLLLSSFVTLQPLDDGAELLHGVGCVDLTAETHDTHQATTVPVFFAFLPTLTPQQSKEVRGAATARHLRWWRSKVGNDGREIIADIVACVTPNLSANFL